ncbi:RNA-binding protein Mug28 [Schizosaccharomyces japonicus yFS275]|uniref:RNA-binding protein Mug28 n=1 Tax=Schizosaccharomyces japonicus (strain yFS275 / FY16936) TaxID=402676 RepID=B6JY09_SCHJY|nr:RNA-binding protein Mug28 [Schizosaccharomyces japonicus yFS275]EEB06427.1 RNA-binding protein Mug28 [Schizosaccharomyces japonicus yFS275]
MSFVEEQLRMQPNNRQFFFKNELFVGNLSDSVTEDDLRKFFAPIGEIVVIQLHNNDTRNSNFKRKATKFAFVVFSNTMQVEQAIEALNDTILCGNKVIVRHRRRKRVFKNVTNLEKSKNAATSIMEGDDTDITNQFSSKDLVSSSKTKSARKKSQSGYCFLAIGILNFPTNVTPLQLYNDFKKHAKIVGTAINQAPPNSESTYAEVLIPTYYDCIQLLEYYKEYEYHDRKLDFFVKAPSYFSSRAQMSPDMRQVLAVSLALQKEQAYARAWSACGMNTSAAEQQNYEPEDPCNVFVKNLDDKLIYSKTLLEQLFEPFGHITSSCLPCIPDTDIPKGYGFVAFSKPEEAFSAITRMNGVVVGEKRIFVCFAESREQRSKRLEMGLRARVQENPYSVIPTQTLNRVCVLPMGTNENQVKVMKRENMQPNIKPLKVLGERSNVL